MEGPDAGADAASEGARVVASGEGALVGSPDDRVATEKESIRHPALVHPASEKSQCESHRIQKSGVLYSGVLYSGVL